MKFLGVIFFLVAMNWSWSLIHSEMSTSEQVHVGIQKDMKRIISEYIKENLPTSNNLKFKKFWTEKVGLKKIKAFFVYSFEDSQGGFGPARVEVEGSALLTRAPDESEEFETWSFDELTIEDNRIEFKEGLEITSESSQ